MLFFAVAGAAIAAAGCNAYAPVPDHPAYDIEVRPIFMAHCARCHGAGGALNIATEPTGPDAAVLPSISGSLLTQFTTNGPWLTQFDTTGDCAATTPTNCRPGAGQYYPLIYMTTQYTADQPEAMPPPPASRLNDWELGVIANWKKNPICSNSANPDPALCPSGPGIFVASP
jgi:hypothetical protein